MPLSVAHAATSTYTRTYTYDAIGNITNKSDVGAYTYNDDGYNNPHAADTVNGVDYTYDNNGNLTSDGTRTYTWNYNDTVASVGKGGTTYSYAYDHAKQRVSANDGSTTTVYPSRYYETDGTNVTKYIYAGDELVAQLKSVGTSTPSTYYVHTDHLGGTNVLTNASSTEAQVLDYYPFGATRVNDDTDGSNIKKQFIGEYADDTDLSYLNARYYSPEVGKFVSQDPVFVNMGVDPRTQQALANPQLMSAYVYSGNNPLRSKDADGEWIETGLDIVSVGLSAKDFGAAVLTGNPLAIAGTGAMLAYDIVAVAVPVLPGSVGVKAAVGAYKAADRVDNAVDIVSKYRRSRPSFGKGQVEEVWNSAKGSDGLVRDPNTGDMINWSPGQSRKGVWDMGHKPGQEYSTQLQSLESGKLSEQQFLDHYRNADNYQPELPRLKTRSAY